MGVLAGVCACNDPCFIDDACAVTNDCNDNGHCINGARACGSLTSALPVCITVLTIVPCMCVHGCQANASAIARASGRRIVAPASSAATTARAQQTPPARLCAPAKAATVASSVRCCKRAAAMGHASLYVWARLPGLYGVTLASLVHSLTHRGYLSELQ